MGWSAFRPTGLTYHHPARSFKGYTIIVPIGGSETCYLIDMSGRIVHRWRTDGMLPFYARLLPNGRLMVGGNPAGGPPPPTTPWDQPPPPLAEHIRRFGGRSTILREVAWDGTTVWEHQDPGMHHDFVRLPNGHTLFPVWVPLPDELAAQVQGGVRRPGEHFPPLVSDDFVEIDETGNEVARLHLWQALDPVQDPICPLEQRWEWTHTNSLAVLSDGNLVFSCRDNSRVGILDRATGALRWRYGWPETAHQHDARPLANGNILIFDNGMHRVGMPRSRVMEVNPNENNRVVWEYVAVPEAQFFSAHISGAERLPNGNTLICEGAAGRVFEVTERREIVWEWINPLPMRAAVPGGNWLFRAHRYGPDHPAFAGHELDPARYADLNRTYGLDAGRGG